MDVMSHGCNSRAARVVAVIGSFEGSARCMHRLHNAYVPCPEDTAAWGALLSTQLHVQLRVQAILGGWVVVVHLQPPVTLCPSQRPLFLSVVPVRC